MFYQLYDHSGEIIDTSDTILGDFSLDYELDGSPSMEIKLPICYLGCLDQRLEIIMIPDDGTRFHGVLSAYKADPATASVDVDFEQILYEWRRESVPIGIVKKEATVDMLMHDPNFVYSRKPWKINVENNSDRIEFEFSRETKRDALDKIIGLTTELHYRIPRQSTREMDIGLFGEHKDFKIDETNLVENLTISTDRSGIVNIAVALSDRSDSGGTSTTLREVFMHPEWQIPRFPVVATGNTINTAALPYGYRYPEYAPNNDTEYAVIDEEGIELEHGEVFEGTFSSNAIAPVQVEGKEITNQDRENASRMVYQMAVRKLRASRHIVRYEVSVPELPATINVGDKIFLDVSDGAFCVADWLYIVSIVSNVTTTGHGPYQLVLQDSLSDLIRVKEG